MRSRILNWIQGFSTIFTFLNDTCLKSCLFWFYICHRSALHMILNRFFFQLTICYRTFKLWLISPRFFSLSACTINKMGNRIWTSQGGRNLKFVLHSTNDSCLYIVLPIKKNQTMMLVTKKKD